MTDSNATKRFYDWVWPHRAVVLRAARIQTGNDAEADDLAQETLTKAFKTINGFQPGSNIKAWLLTILRNTRIDRLRTAAGSAKPISLDDLIEEPASPAVADADQSAWTEPDRMLAAFSDASVINALGDISEDLRWTLLLVDVEGLDHQEAAKILEVPIGTVKSRVHRGHAALRQSLLDVARERRMVLE